MRPQTYPTSVSTLGADLSHPEARIERMIVGSGVFIPPHEALAGYGLSPRESSALLLCMQGHTVPQVGDQLRTTPHIAKQQLDSATDKLAIPGIYAASRTVLALGATVLSRENPIRNKRNELLPVDDLMLLQYVSYGRGIAYAAGELSAHHNMPISEHATRERLTRIRNRVPGHTTRLLITRAFLSGQLPLPGLRLPPEQQ